MKRDGVFERKDRAGWWVSYVDARGERKKEKVVAHTRKQALDVLSGIKARVQREEILGVREFPDTTTAELFSRYLKHQKARVTPATVERTATILKAIAAKLPAKLKAIDKRSVAALVETRKAAPATIQKEMTILKHALRLAVEWDLIAVNPAASVKLPKVTENRTRYLSPPELKAALAAAPDWMRAPIALAALTGMRRGELLGLKWTDLDGHQAYLRETKNGTVRVVTLNDLAFGIIESLPRTSVHVLPGVNPQKLSVYTRRLFADQGIKDASFHTLRHTAASLMVMGGVDLYSTGQILGHKTPRMTQRYAHLSPGHLAKAVGTLDTSLAGLLGAGDPLETIETVSSPSEPFQAAPKKRFNVRMDKGSHRKTSSRARGLESPIMPLSRR